MKTRQLVPGPESFEITSILSSAAPKINGGSFPVHNKKEFRLQNLSAKRGRFSDNFLIARVRILSEAFLLHRNAVSYAIKKDATQRDIPESYIRPDGYRSFQGLHISFGGIYASTTLSPKSLMA